MLSLQRFSARSNCLSSQGVRTGHWASRDPGAIALPMETSEPSDRTEERDAAAALPGAAAGEAHGRAEGDTEARERERSPRRGQNR
eukprot:10328245-Alexandrium_andersonii.AAC.1